MSTHLIITNLDYDLVSGYAVTLHNDSLKGSFYVNHPKGVLFSKESKVGGKSDTVLANSSLKMIFLEQKGKNIYEVNGFSEYQYFAQHKKIFRKIYSEGNEYFDENRTSRTPDKILGDILIVPKDQTAPKVLVSTKDKSPRKALVDYLNKTWNGHYSYKDFKTSIDVIREIEKRAEEL